MAGEGYDFGVCFRVACAHEFVVGLPEFAVSAVLWFVVAVEAANAEEFYGFGCGAHFCCD